MELPRRLQLLDLRPIVCFGGQGVGDVVDDAVIDVPRLEDVGRPNGWAPFLVQHDVHHFLVQQELLQIYFPMPGSVPLASGFSDDKGEREGEGQPKNRSQSALFGFARSIP